MSIENFYILDFRKAIIGQTILFLLASMGLCGQENDVKFYHLTPNDGLSQATIYDIVQDSTGYIWIGTAEGLNKYNGTTFDIFLNDRTDSVSLSYDYIRKLFVDKYNQLWVGSANGLDRLDKASKNFKHFDTQGFPEKGLPDSNISDLHQDKTSSKIWISTRNTKGIISFFNPENQSFSHFQHTLTKQDINRITSDSLGRVYMAHSDGLISSFDPKENQFSKIDSFDHDILSIYMSTVGDLWVGIDYSGIMIYHTDGTSTAINQQMEGGLKMNNNIPWHITEDSSGYIWVATDGGLHQINLEEKKTIYFTHNDNIDQSINSNFLRSVCIDNDNRIWAGTTASGVSVYDPNSVKFHHVRRNQSSSNTLSSNIIWSFEQYDSSSLLIGTALGLNLYDVKEGVKHIYIHDRSDVHSISNNRIWDIEKGLIDQEYWLGTSGGLNKMRIDNKGDAKFQSWQHDVHDPKTISANSVRCLNVVSSDSIFLGTTSDGMNLFNPQTEQFVRFRHDERDSSSISNDGVKCITRTSDKTIWIGTDNGLNRMVGPSFFQTFYSNDRDPLSLSDNSIRVLFEDSGSRLWIGTDNGLNLLTGVFDRTIEVRRFTIKDGLPNNRIYGIIEDVNQNIWVSTNRGISKLNLGDYTFENYNYNDGLQSDEFNQSAAFKMDSTMFFGGFNGFNYFLPDEIKRKKEFPKMVFTDLEIEYQNIQSIQNNDVLLDINEVDKIVLKPGQRSFALEFTSLNYAKKKEDQYAYILEGYDSEWYDSGQQHKAAYTNIPPGKYTFKVKVGNKEGVWSKDILEKKIEIIPYFWQTRGFQLLALCLLLGIVYSYYKWRVRSLIDAQIQLEEGVRKGTEKINQQNEELEKTIAQLKSTQSQLIKQEKLASIGQLTAGIAHEINNPINFIKNSTEALQYDIDDLNELFEILLNVQNLKPDELALKLSTVKKDLDLPMIIGEINELVSSIKTGSARTTEIVKSLRYFSHSNEQKKEWMNIHDPIESALVILKNNYKGRIVIKKKYDSSIPLIKARPGEINQVLINVINNAIQAIEAEGEINIVTQYTLNNVTLKIQDSGIGIPEVVMSKIFEPFYTTKDVGQGTGLGLSISQGIVIEHGGEMEVASEEGIGTTVTIKLPLGQISNLPIIDSQL